MSEQDKEITTVTEEITLFNSSLIQKERDKALKNLFEGRTSPSEIRTYIGRGGKELSYVNGYDMFRQIALVTAYRWSHKKTSTIFRPDEKNPRPPR